MLSVKQLEGYAPAKENTSMDDNYDDANVSFGCHILTNELTYNNNNNKC